MFRSSIRWMNCEANAPAWTMKRSDAAATARNARSAEVVANRRVHDNPNMMISALTGISATAKLSSATWKTTHRPTARNE